jgi:precorrin-6B methylase 2
VDIGSGDGRIVIALAKKGAIAHGIEINPFLVWLSRRNIQKAGLEGKAFIHRADMWKQNFSSYDIVTLYMTQHAVNRLETKLMQELKPKARVVANYYTFKHWKPLKRKDTLYLFVKQKHR